MYNDKLKIFVRYHGGACGHFISLMILSLTKSVHMIEKHSGHPNSSDFMSQHNFGEQFDKKDHYLFKAVTNPSSNIKLEHRTKFIKLNFKFYPTEDPLYVVHTHAYDPTPLIDAFDNTRLVAITHTEEDIPQMSYNFITKNLLHDFAVQKDTFLGIVQWVQRTYNRLLDVNPETISINSDIRLLTYIHHLRYHRMQFSDEYPNISKSKIFKIKFEDIMNKTLIAKLDDLISFLGITVSEERKQATIQMIHEYVDNQTIIPFDIKIDSFP